MTGASSGIGLETVKGLCKAGATVVIGKNLYYLFLPVVCL